MNPDPDTPRVPPKADDPYLTQLQMMAESDPELEAWLESTVLAPPEPAANAAPAKDPRSEKPASLAEPAQRL